MITRPLKPGEEAAACEFARQVFDRTAGAALTAAGIREFHRYAEREALEERLKSDHLVIVTESRGSLVGLVELRHHDHIAMLFVDPSHHGRGIGRRLFLAALSECRAAPEAGGLLAVHSAPDAVGFYERMGFRATGPEQTVHGLRFVPMRLAYRDP